MAEPVMSRAPVSETQPAHEETSVFEWAWQETRFRIGQEVSSNGTGGPLLMLPAMSTVSTREEPQALADALVARRIGTAGVGFTFPLSVTSLSRLAI